MSSLALLFDLSESRLAVILAGATVTAAVALVSVRLARRSRASVRHLWLLSAFAVLGLLPIASVVIPSIQIAVPVAAADPAQPNVLAASVTTTTDVTALIDDAGSASGAVRRTPAPISLLGVVAVIWVVGAALCLVPIVVGLIEVRSLRRTSTPWPDAGNDVLLSDSIRGPVTFGVFRPVIVVPIDAKDWPPEDLERALVHEREHVWRRDWLSLVCARAISAIYWFHPLVWAGRRRLELEAERACDDAVLRHEAERAETADATAYADQLVVLAQRLSSASRSPLLAMANRADLAARVGSLLDSRQRRGRAGLAVVVASSIAALLVTTMSTFKLVAAPQSVADAQAPAFEVVSIKPCAPGDPAAPAGGRGGGGATTTSPGRLTIQCSTVLNLINRAYVSFGNPPPINHANTPGNNIIQGAPAWANSEKYAIEAKAEGTPDITTLNGPMLRRLLQERFQLKVHEDVKDVSALALTVAPGGLKITSVDPSSCIESSPNNPGPRVMRTSPTGTPLIFAADAGPDAKPYCTVGISTKPPNIVLDVTGMSFERVVRTLSSLIVDRPVVDRTGATGQYSFHLEFGPDENIRTPATMTPSDLPAGPSIFAAVEKQLGLKLTPTRAPQASLVIDRLERPSDALSTASQAGATPPRYEAATIKPCQVEAVPTGARGAAGGTNATTSPGRFFVPCVTTEQLIYLAYASYGAIDADHLINDDLGSASNSTKIRGGPDWVHSLKDKYSIEATAPGATERTVLMGSMLRTLLEERFHLKIHRETEDVAMYELKVAKSGFKLKPMHEGDCEPNDGPPPAGPPDPSTLFSGKPRCGNLNMMTSDGLTRWSFGTGTMSSLASQLSRSLGTHVIDRTGITDKFVFTFEFTRESDVLNIESSAVSTALKDQLGLTLATTKAPRGFIVIDAIERPGSRTTSGVVSR